MSDEAVVIEMKLAQSWRAWVATLRGDEGHVDISHEDHEEWLKSLREETDKLPDEHRHSQGLPQPPAVAEKLNR